MSLSPLVSLLTLAGCPAEPPLPAEPIPPVEAPGVPTPAEAALTGAPAAGPAGSTAAAVDLGAMEPKQTQEALMAGAHVMVSGKITGSCAGKVVIHVVPGAAPTPDGEPIAPGTGPLTALETAVGDYSMAVPKGTALMLIPHCDVNGDGKVDPATAGDMIAAPIAFAAASANVADVAIVLEPTHDVSGPLIEGEATGTQRPLGTEPPAEKTGKLAEGVEPGTNPDDPSQPPLTSPPKAADAAATKAAGTATPPAAEGKAPGKAPG